MSGHGQDDGNGRSSLPEQLHAHLHRAPPGSESGTASPAPVSQSQAQIPPHQHPHSQLSTPHPPALGDYVPTPPIPIGYPARQQQQSYTLHEDPSRTYFSQQPQQPQYGYQSQQPQQSQPHAGPSGWRQEQTLGYGEQYGWRPPAQAESYARRGGQEQHDAGFGARDTGYGARDTGFSTSYSGRDPTFGGGRDVGFGARRGYSLQGYSDIRSSRSPPPPPATQQQTYGGLSSMTPGQPQSSYYASPLEDPHATTSTSFPGYLPHEHTMSFGSYDRYPQSDLRLPIPGGSGREDVQYGHPLPPGLLGLSMHTGAPGTSYGSQHSVLSSPGPSSLAGPSSLTGPGSSMAASSQGSLLGGPSDPLGFPSSYEYASDPEPLGTLRAVGSTPTPVGVSISTPRGSSSAGGSSGRKADDDDEGKPTKKRKVEIACNFCRQRKLKCSGTKPACDACIKRDQAERCQYEAFPRRRGPGKAPRGTRRTAHRSRATAPEAQAQGFGIMSPAMSEAGPSTSSRFQPVSSQVGSYGQPHHGPSFVQMSGQGYGQPRAGPSSQPLSQGQTPGPSEFGAYAPLPAPGYTLPSPIAPPSLAPYGSALSIPGPSGEDQRRRAEQQRQQQQYEEEQRQFKEEPHGY
ncbi:unnamed protein product [Peniophora sp. CBMAI 1063]|nr:unnamed protein product [Peniophora sp. CBMAI 1063]